MYWLGQLSIILSGGIDEKMNKIFKTPKEFTVSVIAIISAVVYNFVFAFPLIANAFLGKEIPQVITAELAHDIFKIIVIFFYAVRAANKGTNAEGEK
jgi:uncharacterized protein YqhQ